MGKAKIKVSSVFVNSVYDSKTIEVIDNPNKTATSKRVIDFVGPPIRIPVNYQKIVDRYSKAQVAVSAAVPQSIKDVSADPGSPSKKSKIQQGGVMWEILAYADKSQNSYLKRTDDKAG